MICTFTRRYVNPLDLRPEDIDIRDIAHSLALTNRFAGHTKEPVSVGQHSVYVSLLIENQGHSPIIQLKGLLHDASEAYLGDVTKWLKATPEFSAYRDAEERAQRTVDEVFDIPVGQHQAVDDADRRMVRFEALRMYDETMPLFVRPNYPCPTPLEQHVIDLVYGLSWEPWPWQLAETAFLTRFYRLKERISRV